MRPRLLYSLLAVAALLALMVGVGSALIPPASQSNGDTLREPATPQAAATHVTSALAPRDRRSPIPTVATPESATAAPTAEPSTADAPVAATAPAPQGAAPTVVAETVPTATPSGVRLPAKDRVGGPVAVPNNHPGRRWVTLQAGHWKIEEMPVELQHLAGHTGAYAAGVSEVDLNVAVAHKSAQLLADRGFNVEILDATVPVSYTTDLFLAIHADGNVWSGMRGFKAVAPWVSVPASDRFVSFLYEEYGKATGLPTDPVTSVAMADYYAFNPVTYNHAIDGRVPAALLEMGFVTNPSDRQVMAQEQDRVAWGIANAVDRFFRSGAVGDTPTPYPSFTPTITPVPTQTPTFTPTDTPTATPTYTATPVPTDFVSLPLPTVHVATPTHNPQSTTPRPTSTPLKGITTADGRWLPPLAPNGRSLPQPGSNAAPVYLSEAVDEPVLTADGRERQQLWEQFYMPELGRSVWQKGPLLYVRP